MAHITRKGAPYEAFLWTGLLSPLARCFSLGHIWGYDLWGLEWPGEALKKKTFPLLNIKSLAAWRKRLCGTSCSWYPESEDSRLARQWKCMSDGRSNGHRGEGYILRCIHIYCSEGKAELWPSIPVIKCFMWMYRSARSPWELASA